MLRHQVRFNDGTELYGTVHQIDPALRTFRLLQADEPGMYDDPHVGTEYRFDDCQGVFAESRSYPGTYGTSNQIEAWVRWGMNNRFTGR